MAQILAAEDIRLREDRDDVVVDVLPVVEHQDVRVLLAAVPAQDPQPGIPGHPGDVRHELPAVHPPGPGDRPGGTVRKEGPHPVRERRVVIPYMDRAACHAKRM